MRRLALAMLLILLPSVGIAVQLSGVGSVYRAMRLTGTAGTLTVKTSTGSSVAALFAAGTALEDRATVVDASGAGTCCFVMDDSVTQVQISDGSVSDTGPIGPGSGPGACKTFLFAGDRWDQRPQRDLIKSGPGGRTGICSTAIVSVGDTLFPPCAVDGDCAALSAGTCTADASTTRDQRARVGVFLACTGNTIVFEARKEKVGAP